MGWFQRQAAGRPEREVASEHARYLRAAGVDRALDVLAGPFGLRRFLVIFQARPIGSGRQQVQVADVVAMPLASGGGPPKADPTGEALPALEVALTRLHANMSSGPAWSRGLIGYLRDGKGRVELLPLFDDDADAGTIDRLPVPPGPGHPLEQPAWARLLATWESRMQAVQARTARVRPDWTDWTVDGETLTLSYGEGPSARTQRFRCHAVATFAPTRSRFAWQTTRRPGGESPFNQPELSADWGAAHEVALMTAAMLDAAWLFAGEFGDEGELLYAAVAAAP